MVAGKRMMAKMPVMMMDRIIRSSQITHRCQNFTGTSVPMQQGTKEARKMMAADSLTMAEMYMDRYPEELPTFWSGEDPKKKILGILATYPQKL